jgi:hypothetical protein
MLRRSVPRVSRCGGSWDVIAFAFAPVSRDPQSPFGRQLYRTRTVGLIREAQPTLEVDGMRIYDIDLEYLLSTRLCGGRERMKVVQSFFRIRHRDGYPH